MKELWQEQAHKLGGEDLVGKISEIADGIRDIKSAFPDSNFEGHRRFHELEIEKFAERRRLRIAIQEKTISGLIWAGVVSFGGYLVKQISSYFHGGL